MGRARAAAERRALALQQTGPLMRAFSCDAVHIHAPVPGAGWIHNDKNFMRTQTVEEGS